MAAPAKIMRGMTQLDVIPFLFGSVVCTDWAVGASLAFAGACEVDRVVCAAALFGFVSSVDDSASRGADLSNASRFAFSLSNSDDIFTPLFVTIGQCLSLVQTAPWLPRKQARLDDNYCSLQIGCFALLKHP